MEKNKPLQPFNVTFEYGFGEYGVGGYVRCTQTGSVVMFNPDPDKPKKKHTKKPNTP